MGEKKMGKKKKLKNTQGLVPGPRAKHAQKSLKPVIVGQPRALKGVLLAQEALMSESEVLEFQKQKEVLKSLLEDQLQGTVYWDRITAILAYYELCLQETQRQNVTRILTGSDFMLRHFTDCMELLKTNWLEFPVLDIGSGVGVPGLLSALLMGGAHGQWILTDSEKKKGFS